MPIKVATGPITGIGRVRLTLEVTPQPTTAAGGDILAVAVLTTERDSVPLDGQPITFWNGPDEGPTSDTANGGRTAHTFTRLANGVYAISANTSGIHVTVPCTLGTPAAAPKQGKIAQPIVKALGGNGKFEIAVFVSYEDGTPVADGTGVHFYRSEPGQPGFAAKETKHTVGGRASWDIGFSAVESNVAVQVERYTVELEHLQGPSRAPKPPDPPKWTEGELRGSLWGYVCRAWKRGSEDLKRQRRG